MEMSPKIAILGTGAIGGLIGGYLSKAGKHITVIDQWEDNINKIRSDGLTITSQEEKFTTRVDSIHLNEISSHQQLFDVIILSVKSYDTESSVKLIEPLLTPNTFIISAQNSINEDSIANIIGWARVIGCIVSVGAAMYEPGHVVRTTKSDLHSLTLGEPSGEITPRLARITEELSAVGPTKTTTNLLGERWTKLSINCIGNAMSAFTGLTSSEMRENPQARKVALQIGLEILKVTDRLGLNLGPIWGVPSNIFRKAATESSYRSKAEQLMIGNGKTIGTGRPSLSQDMIKGRKMEVDFLNGYVVSKAKELGIATPVNKAVVKITKHIEKNQLEPSVSNFNHIPN